MLVPADCARVSGDTRDTISAEEMILLSIRFSVGRIFANSRFRRGRSPEKPERDRGIIRQSERLSTGGGSRSKRYDENLAVYDRAKTTGKGTSSTRADCALAMT